MSSLATDVNLREIFFFYEKQAGNIQSLGRCRLYSENLGTH